jgi:hypothetical protein
MIHALTTIWILEAIETHYIKGLTKSSIGIVVPLRIYFLATTDNSDPKNGDETTLLIHLKSI